MFICWPGWFTRMGETDNVGDYPRSLILKGNETEGNLRAKYLKMTSGH